MTAPTFDLDSLVAIDTHVHVMAAEGAAKTPENAVSSQAFSYFRREGESLPDVDDLAAYYRERKMAAVIFTVDSEFGTLRPRISNESIIEGADRHRDVCIPFASIDPHRGLSGVAEAKELIADGRVRGFKFHPSLQSFYPDERLAYPLYEVIAEAKLPVVFHTGQTGIGAGRPGGAGVRLKYSNPLHLDDVAADFPDLPIILAHPSTPWLDIALSILAHKPNVYMDLSGWAPKYFEDRLVRQINSILKKKMLFGSDYPLLTPDRWMDEFAALPIKDEVRELVYKKNAVGVLGLGESS